MPWTGVEWLPGRRIRLSRVALPRTRSPDLTSRVVVPFYMLESVILVTVRRAYNLQGEHRGIREGCVSEQVRPIVSGGKQKLGVFDGESFEGVQGLRCVSIDHSMG